jgi:hypothetical protein
MRFFRPEGQGNGRVHAAGFAGSERQCCTIAVQAFESSACVRHADA